MKGKYKSKVGFGFQVGAGVIFSDHFSIGAHYYGLGKAKMKYKEVLNGNDMHDWYDDGKYPSNNFVLRLGYHF